jgi:hypothetical protein
MSAAPALGSVGDHGVLNAELTAAQANVWIDRDFWS